MGESVQTKRVPADDGHTLTPAMLSRIWIRPMLSSETKGSVPLTGAVLGEPEMR